LGKAISQEEIAVALEVSRTWYVLLERGTVRASIALLCRIANTFCLDAGERALMLSLALPDLQLDPIIDAVAD